VRAAVAAVEDPEYPGITIDDLGILADVRVVTESGSVEVDLLPTRLGCPALDVIRRDVENATRGVDGVRHTAVRFRHRPAWTPERVSIATRRRLAREMTITIRSPAGLTCPVCGGTDVEDVSEVGPAPCRSVARCRACRNPVEVLRG
jgi:ring-1,2-phenylacetyl-CoA epoxidase subunit PaaD